jgi:FkbM family methyltransferase
MKNFIQIGASEGMDYFQNLVQSINERVRVILIEPNKKSIPILKKNYENLLKKHEIIFLELAIVPFKDEDFINLYHDEDNLVQSLSSLIKRNSHNLPDVMVVSCSTLNELFENMKIFEVDEICIDTEGLDYEILLSLDLDKVKIKKIVCEIWPYDQDDFNKKFRTGPHLLPQLKVKFKNYDFSEIFVDGMLSLKLEKK